MSNGAILLITVQGAIFALWIFWMFRTLFLLSRRARQDTGHLYPGPRQFIVQSKRWLSSPEDRRARIWLGITTACLFSVTFLTVLANSSS